MRVVYLDVNHVVGQFKVWVSKYLVWFVIKCVVSEYGTSGLIE